MNEKDLLTKILGAQLKKLRLEKGLSQERFGEQLHLDGNNLGRIERGNNLPSTMTLFRLYENHISIDKLFDNALKEMNVKMNEKE